MGARGSGCTCSESISWLSYSKAEGKAALLGENQKTVRALQTRVRVLTSDAAS